MNEATRATRLRDELARAVDAFISACADGHERDQGRDALLVRVLRFQAARVLPYARLVRARSRTIDSIDAAPALPTDVFRFTRVAAHDSMRDAVTFRTSGTTSGERGAHSLRTMALYERAARTAADLALVKTRESLRIVSLVPSRAEAPESSLAAMVHLFTRWYGRDGAVYAWKDGAIDVDLLTRTLVDWANEKVPVMLLGTSFAFVFAEDLLGERRFVLPAGSRLMQTGGFKGKSRSIDSAEMEALLARRYGIPPEAIITEYGMTELSSQMYGPRFGVTSDSRELWVPPWVRATPVDPETLEPVKDGERGILRIDDLANVDTCAAIQTADVAVRRNGRIALIGRAEGAIPRGCSLAVEEALART